MTIFERFAEAMSDELFQDRAVDLKTTTIYLQADHTSDSIPADYVEKVLGSDIHVEQIKLLLRLAVLADVTQNPKRYDKDSEGEYIYSGDVWEHSYLVDAYLEDQFLLDHPEFHTVFQCSNCDSNNVQVKAWVRPNQNNKLVDYLSDQVTDGFCDDCHQHVMTDTVEVNTRHGVIGYQVRNINTDELHPAILSDKMVYNLLDADAMLRDHTVDGHWKLKTIWTADIMDPVKMFSGDPRNA